TNTPSVHREITLMKIKIPPIKRQEIFQIVDVFKGKVIDISRETLTLEITGTTAKIEAVIDILKPYGIHEIARTGRVSISRGLTRIGGIGNG
ncbi:hypothetical protein LCGC14_2270930, partial [marine sediment metagenome]